MLNRFSVLGDMSPGIQAFIKADMHFSLYNSLYNLYSLRKFLTCKNLQTDSKENEDRPCLIYKRCKSLAQKDVRLSGEMQADS